MTVTVLGLFAVLVWMAHRTTREMRPARSQALPSPGDAIARAAQRLQAGDITAEEYVRIVAILRT